jgi:hypothetical protein
VRLLAERERREKDVPRTPIGSWERSRNRRASGVCKKTSVTGGHNGPLLLYRFVSPVISSNSTSIEASARGSGHLSCAA